MTQFAVIKTGGKQYRVATDEVIVVEKLVGDAGDRVIFDSVLMVGDGAAADVGAPMLAGAQVAGEILEQRRAPKIRIVKKKPRTNDRKTMGHRQHETVVRIAEIAAKGGLSASAAAKAKPAAKAGETDAAAAKPKKAAKAADAAPATSGGLKFLSAPDGAVDDLKLIGGVGPALEKKLNALGLYHFRQIAALTAAEIEAVDAELNFKGRIEREEWIEQAKELMAGGEPRAKTDNAAKAKKDEDGAA